MASFCWMVFIMVNLTDFYKSLCTPLYRNKYETASNYLNLGYKIITGKDAYYSPFPSNIKQFIMEHGEVIALPNIFIDKVVGVLLRPIQTKAFRYFSDYNIPYGAGINNKPYLYPWVIVESCLDSDFLRTFYPYVIATLGVSVSNFTQSFLFGTAPYVIVGFDNDEAGIDAFRRMSYKYKGRVKRIIPPFKNKDFGDTLEFLYKNDMIQYNIESMIIKSTLTSMTGV